GEAAPAVRGIDIHAAQFRRRHAEIFEPEHSGELVAVIGDEKRAVLLGIIVREAADLGLERNRHIGFERLAQCGRRKLTADLNEQVARRSLVRIGVAADRKAHLCFGASASSAPRNFSSSFSAAPSTLGNSSFNSSIVSTIASAMTRRANHLLSAGTTYHGASGRLVWRIISS